MAYYDILAGDSYGRYNKKLARLTNLQTACYWSVIVNIISKVVKKKTYDDNGFFKLDRKYITEETALSESDQIVCDSALHKLEVVDIDPVDPDRIRVRLEVMTSILVDDDLADLKKISKIAKTSKADKAEGKRAGITSRLKDGVVESDVDLLQAYRDWIDVCYDKGIVRQPQVQIFQDTINNYSDRKEVKLEIIKTATNLAYRDAAWAISQYESKKKSSSSKLPEQQSVKSINSDISF